MKIKSDFVTNSSSSSFIVVFPKKIIHYDDVWFYIKGTDKAHQVYKDARNQKPYLLSANNQSLIKKLTSVIKGGCLSDLTVLEYIYKDINCLKEDVYQDPKTYIDFTNFTEEILDSQAKVIVKKFIELIKSGWVYFFKYGDEGGEFFSEMEHGDTFKELRHIRISYH
ncbi:MAG: hypothetical protein PVG65_00350 [Candidatus Thorarchaeota archaeon]|jgi:hypothetical protein